MNAKKESKVRVLFDTGSHRSFISAKVVSRLGLRPVRSEKLGIKPFGSVEAEYRMRDIVEILLYSLSGDKCVKVECFVVEDISNISNCHAEIAKKKYPHLNEIWFSDICRTEDTLCVDVLIGSDSLWEFQEGETRRGGPGEPVAVKTKLGWVLSGPLKFQGKSFDSFDNSNVNFLPQVRQDLGMAGIERNVNRLWDLETLGIRQENEIYEAVIDDIQFTGTRYSVGLPWKISQEKKKINVMTTIAEKPQGIDNVIDVTKYSSLGKLLRVTSYVLRFINNMKGKKETHDLNHRRLNVSEIRQAERHWIQQIQSTLRNEESFKMVAS